MTSCRDIVNGALRKLGKLGAGREPRLADSTDALEALRGLYRQLITSGAFGRLQDVIPTGAEYTAGENQRIFRNSDVTLEINLPETVPNWYPCGPRPYDEECATYVANPTDRNVRPPRDCSIVSVVDAFTAQTVTYLYDGQQKLWIGLDDLALTDEAPLGYRDPEGLKAALAMSIVDEFGGQIGQATARLAGMFLTGLVTRSSFSDPPVYGEYV